MRRRLIAAATVAALALMAMAPDLRLRLAGQVMRGVRAVQAFAQPQRAQTEILLEEMRLYALQLGAFDNGAHAQEELVRLMEEGLPAVIWQEEQMRLICSAALSKGALDLSAAKGRDAWVIEKTLAPVTLRVQSGAAQLDDVRALLTLPDAMLAQVCGGETPLQAIVENAQPMAQGALDAHPEEPVYAQLAQSLVNWCALMEQMRASVGEAAARHYASATLALLCDELRRALLSMDAQSAASTASAQRTPSTAADVMPPA